MFLTLLRLQHPLVYRFAWLRLWVAVFKQHAGCCFRGGVSILRCCRCRMRLAPYPAYK